MSQEIILSTLRSYTWMSPERYAIFNLEPDAVKAAIGKSIAVVSGDISSSSVPKALRALDTLGVNALAIPVDDRPAMAQYTTYHLVVVGENNTSKLQRAGLDISDRKFDGPESDQFVAGLKEGRSGGKGK